MLNNFEKFSFPSIEKRWTKDKETDRQKEKRQEKTKKKRKREKREKEKNKTKRLIDAITSYYGLVMTPSLPPLLSYPKSRDALASKNV